MERVATTIFRIQQDAIPLSIVKPTGRSGKCWIPRPDLAFKRRRRERATPRGSRGGLEARLKTTSPSMPSLFLANAQSMVNKMDELRAMNNYCSYVKYSCATIFTETWLRETIADSATELPGKTLHRADRDKEDSGGKGKGGGLGIYIRDEWCRNARVVSNHCSPELEHLTVKCRPFYLPREFSCVYINAVYITPASVPGANQKAALNKLHDHVNKQLTTAPEAAIIVAGDFNHADLKSTLPKFYQHVKCATRGENTLDMVYTNVKQAYRAIPMPHIGKADHTPVALIPTYTSVRRREPIISKRTTTWPANATSSLQLSLHDTRWEELKHQDLEQYTTSVVQHIKTCVDTVTVRRRARVYPNTKPWMTTKVKKLLRKRGSAFRELRREEARPQSDLRTEAELRYKASRAALRRGITEAKAEYKGRIEGHFLSNDSRRVWRGLQQMTNYKASRRSADELATPELVNDLNAFYARFNATSVPPTTPAPPPPSPQHPSNTGSLVLTEHDVRRTLRGVDPRKATGPDGIPGRVLRDCADQLAPVFTDIFNQSLSQATVPTCFKTSTIIPVPKNNTVEELNDYRPVALTPIVMKCFEKLVRTHIVSALPPEMDPNQFAYRANRSTEDAIATALHTSLTHLEKRRSYVRLLFVDFSSAFNTIIPDILVRKLGDLGLPPPICSWVRNFLTTRPQSVRIGAHTSATLTLSTGSPQGCVLSPLLYSLYTHDFTPAHTSNSIIKFADDTTVVGLISDENETHYRDEVEQLAERCRANNLLLNKKKTVEIVVDFRKKKEGPVPPLLIDGGCVERVTSFKFLGVHIQEDLHWGINSKVIHKKARQRLHFLRILRKYQPSQELMVSFYRSTVESILTYCMGVWFEGCTEAERTNLQRVVNSAQKIIGCPLPSLESIFETRCHRRVAKIRADPYHPGNGLFATMRSGWRLREIGGKKRLTTSFYPAAIRIANTALTRQLNCPPPPLLLPR